MGSVLIVFVLGRKILIYTNSLLISSLWFSESKGPFADRIARFYQTRRLPVPACVAVCLAAARLSRSNTHPAHSIRDAMAFHRAKSACKIRRSEAYNLRQAVRRSDRKS